MDDLNAMNKIRVAVIGASGYAGLELVRLLVRHPGCELAALTSLEYPGRPFSQIFPALAGICDLPFEAPDPEASRAGPTWSSPRAPPNRHGDDARVPGPRLQGGGPERRFSLPGRQPSMKSGISRIPRRSYWRRRFTACRNSTRAAVRRTRLVGNPGCYPTCVILGLAPLVAGQTGAPDSVIADCKSGASGAGRQASLAIQFCEVNDGFRAYKVVEHRHTPEMEQELSLLAGKPVSVTFTPHLVPMSRGILGTLYANLSEPRSEAELRELYRDFYQDHPFVRLHPPGSLPDTRDVRGANFCDLALRVDQGPGRVIVVSAIDNLTKGAAGQAVQNFNLMDGFPRDHGVGDGAVLPLRRGKGEKGKRRKG